MRSLVGQERMYAFSQRSSARHSLKAGDWITFYAKGKGLVAHAQAIGIPQHRTSTEEIYKHHPWIVQLSHIKLYPDTPIEINLDIRRQLEAFQHRDLTRKWSWFVQMTRRVSRHDFVILTKL